MEESEARVHFRVIRFIHEAGLRLRVGSVSLATACVVYHKFFSEYSVQDFDPYLIGSTAVYLAGKIEEEHVKLRDVVNVCYKTLHRRKPPLEVGDTYTALHDSIAACELFILRCLAFRVSFIHPHKFLLHYLKSLQNWFVRKEWENLPIASTSWALLRDSYHSNMCLKYPPEHIAVAVIYLALLCYGTEVPNNKYAEIPWWKAICDSVTIENIHSIIRSITATYEMETTFSKS